MKNRQKGNALEARASHLLGIRPTANSGAYRDDADLKDDRFLVECKVKGGTAGPIPANLKKKLSKQSVKWNRDWVYVVQNRDHEDFVVLTLDAFAELYRNYKDLRQDFGILKDKLDNATRGCKKDG